MPGNLQVAVVAAGAVFPLSLSTAYTESQSFPILTNQYKDGTLQMSLIQDGQTYYGHANPPRPLRTWKLTKRLTTAQLTILQNFYYAMQGGALYTNADYTGSSPAAPFYFYDVFAGNPIGSNFDPTGSNFIGRVTVNFQWAFSYVGTITRNNVPEMTLVEVA